MRLGTRSCLIVLTLGLVACGKNRDDDFTFPMIPAGGDTTVQTRTSGAFTMPATNLDATELEQHGTGDTMFEATFVLGPAKLHPGLGPAFNNNSCASCHLNNGRGNATLGKAGSVNSPMLVRVSVDPAKADQYPGVTNPHANGPIGVPGLGGQLQDQAVYGATPEVVIALSWAEVTGQYNDGTVYTLRYPVLSYSGQQEHVVLMNNPGILRSLRQTPPVIGLGLLEAVADETLLSMEDPDDANHDGIRGHVNRVWDPQHEQVALGRFGWKASAPSLLVQTAAAFAEDMGVHNYLFPDTDGTEEITQEQVSAAAYYTQTLGVPDRDRNFANTTEGEKLFREAGCASCHRPSLTTGSDHPIAALRNQTFAPYTDLLLHDMGDGLADYRADYAATGKEWRTPPLWGIGLANTVLPGSAYMHDGRARTLEEAILWHGGEAAAAQEKFKAMHSTSRANLLKFLKSL